MAELLRSFRVMLRMEIKPGMSGEFEETWTRIGSMITKNPANLGQWLMLSAEEEGVYYIISDWVDERRFREFELSDEHFEHRVQLHPYRSEGSMTSMHVIRHLVGSATETQW
jgi:heme-degrading monooxygenase HmoA